jgi:EAL domain-containing protein (putative c-di-GMP-specific phosphodiesterase class I)
MDMRLPPDVVPASAPPAALPAFTYAFQPIVDAAARHVHAYEALIRGPQGEPARHVLQRVPAERRFEFDQIGRAAAIGLAARSGFGGRLNLNLLPQLPAAAARAIRHTAAAATRHGVALERLMLELTGDRGIEDPAGLAEVLNEYRGLGMMVAIDHFAGGEAGLRLFDEFQPDAIKIAMRLVRGIEAHPGNQALVRGIARGCAPLGVEVIAKGVETPAEVAWLVANGIRLFQGAAFGVPGLDCFPEPRFPVFA